MNEQTLVKESNLIGRKVFGQWGCDWNYGVITGETIYNEVIVKWEGEEGGESYVEIKDLIGEQEVENFDSVGVYLFSLEATQEQTENEMMEVAVRNGVYSVDLENGKVYNKLNGARLTEQEKISHLINIAKRIRKIRNVYGSKIKKQGG